MFNTGTIRHIYAGMTAAIDRHVVGNPLQLLSEFTNGELLTALLLANLELPTLILIPTSLAWHGLF